MFFIGFELANFRKHASVANAKFKHSPFRISSQSNHMDIKMEEEFGRRSIASPLNFDYDTKKAKLLSGDGASSTWFELFAGKHWIILFCGSHVSSLRVSVGDRDPFFYQPYIFSSFFSDFYLFLLFWFLNSDPV
jgi:hypothetical protein